MWKKVIIFFVLVILTIAIFIWNKNNKLQDRNYCPIEIETFDGTRSPYHPSVLYFENSFNGYNFWMAETPLPPNGRPYPDRWECPSIHVSNDGYHWDSPVGDQSFTNPIDDLSNNEIKDYDYFSDPHIFFHDSLIECWYRKSLRHGENIYFSSNTDQYLFRKTTYDGRVWSPRDTIGMINQMFGTEAVSPALLYDGGYYMWIVSTKKTAEEHNCIYFQTSEDAFVWSDKVKCSFIGDSGNEIINPWHIDVQSFDGYIWLVDYEFSEKINLWKSLDGKNFSFVKTLLDHKRVIGALDENGLYRACLLKVSDNDYRLYYSSRSEFRTNIGVLQGQTILDMKPVNVGNGRYTSYWGLLAEYVHKICRHIFQ